ncbi:MAG: VWA domain-containing protein [Selenomonadaceae bacterium]|nr:VWA domain-containing protein [Selenomonadaceae bacterium]
MANVTEIVFILDRSGSMSGLESDTIGGFNSMLAKHKNGENAAFVSTVLFDHESEVIHDRIPIAEVPNLTEKEYFVRGNTALLDAVGDAIKHIRNIHKYARPEDVPAKTVFIITTDGMENASRRYTYDDIKKLIETQKEKGWDFVFLGANIDSVEVSGRMGISANRAVNYHNDKRGTKARYSSMSNFVSAAFAAPTMADVADAWREEVDEDFKSRK